MLRTNFKELLSAGVHFGHLKRKWNPNMAPYIFMERNGIHIIDLYKTVDKIDTAAAALKQIAKSGRKILFVATKKQAKEIVAEKIKTINMPYITERWTGGMLTNFPTIRKAVKKMSAIDKMAVDGTFDYLSKKEKLQIKRQRAKLDKVLGSIAELTRLPAALFVVDISKEHIAVREAKRLSIPVFAIVDTNSDPEIVDFAIPANDDASKSISLIVDIIVKAVQEGLEERKLEREKDVAMQEKEATKKEAHLPEQSGKQEKKRIKVKSEKIDLSRQSRDAKAEPVRQPTDEKPKVDSDKEKITVKEEAKIKPEKTEISAQSGTASDEKKIVDKPKAEKEKAEVIKEEPEAKKKELKAEKEEPEAKKKEKPIRQLKDKEKESKTKKENKNLTS